MKCIIFLMLLLTNYSELGANSTTELLQTVPDKHREDLNHLFTLIFLEQDGVYTIFGDKPLSLGGAFILPSWQATLARKGGSIGHLWKIWQNYQHLFPFKKYIMTGEKCKIGQSNRTAFHIFVINKKAFINILTTHLALFERILKKKIDPNEFLENIANGKISVWNSINHNEFLLGILLGYGEHNASLFNRKNHHFFDLFCLDEVLEKKKVKLEFLGEERHPMMIVNPVQFAADLTHPETITLKQKYKKMHEKISAIYLKGDFLEITLSKLMESARE